jgi:hypothetical protein
VPDKFFKNLYSAALDSCFQCPAIVGERVRTGLQQRINRTA